MTGLGQAVLGVAMAVLPGAALAGLTVCNDTPARQTVAVGYQSGKDWISEGWWNVKAGDCQQVIDGDLKNRYYYLMARSSGWRFAHQDYGFCTTSKAFTITGDTDCAARGYDLDRFRKVDTGTRATSFTVNLAGLVSRVQEAEPKPKPQPEPEPVPFGGDKPPGTWGEPCSSVPAIFQDCVTETEAPFCTFHADGTKFFVHDDGRTPPVVLSMLRAYLPATPIELSGDLEAIHDRTADIVLREVMPRKWNRWDTLLDRMQGQWYAVDDPNATFTILGPERENRHDGSLTGLDYLTLSDRCEHLGGGEYLVAIEEETGEQYCYGIDEIGDWTMTLMYLPRGNFLEYRKLD